MDLVVCELCGAELHILGKHLADRHGLTVVEYVERFPGAQVVNESFREIKRDCWRDQHGEPRWTRDRVLAAMRAWAAEHGRPPSARDWQRPRRQLRAGGIGPGNTGVKRPSARYVQKLFGSWNAAMVAAGFDPRPGLGKDAERTAHQELAAG